MSGNRKGRFAKFTSVLIKAVNQTKFDHDKSDTTKQELASNVWAYCKAMKGLYNCS